MIVTHVENVVVIGRAIHTNINTKCNIGHNNKIILQNTFSIQTLEKINIVTEDVFHSITRKDMRHDNNN